MATKNGMVGMFLEEGNKDTGPAGLLAGALGLGIMGTVTNLSLAEVGIVPDGGGILAFGATTFLLIVGSLVFGNRG